MNFLKLSFIFLWLCNAETIYYARAIDNTEWTGGLRKQVNIDEPEFISAVCYYFNLFCPYNYTRDE